jgi:hypothetical protein
VDNVAAAALTIAESRAVGQRGDYTASAAPNAFARDGNETRIGGMCVDNVAAAALTIAESRAVGQRGDYTASAAQVLH